MIKRDYRADVVFHDSPLGGVVTPRIAIEFSTPLMNNSRTSIAAALSFFIPQDQKPVKIRIHQVQPVMVVVGPQSLPAALLGDAMDTAKLADDVEFVFPAMIITDVVKINFALHFGVGVFHQHSNCNRGAAALTTNTLSLLLSGAVSPDVLCVPP